jgi:Fur family zinc uptake transcriptional regulator
VLAAQTRPVSAYDLAEDLSHQLGRRVAPNSVYRILDLFVRSNLARRVESVNAYVANTHPGCRHDCIFLICDSCGRVVHNDDDRLTTALVEAARGAGFADIRPVVELRGTCAQCSEGQVAEA